MGQQRNVAHVREVVALLLEFNPTSSSSLNARPFINHVDILRNAYRWNDEILVFAIQQKMQGAAKY